MGRIMAFDVGAKRIGVAVTDPLQIIARAETTCNSKEIYDFVKNYTKSETIESFVVGEPKNLDNTATDATGLAKDFVKKLQREYPGIPVHRIDERFTSKIASQSLHEMGLKKKDRQNKSLVDQVSAVLILQTFLEQKNLFKS